MQSKCFKLRHDDHALKLVFINSFIPSMDEEMTKHA
jgi:hypothetical protein